MKDKKYVKKLVLNKKTVACLENGELNVVKVGGNPWIDGSRIVEQCPTINCAP
ncbi:MAG: hypothetical protein GTO45_32330 [Candidatus Aminicenantes bacterium]|nr:hypothetical protein [Candidatus Aminicenantes bacterium]NIM84837.1 hypothetical protein [Candidatus Aminicenantes bacterium]NIN22830.1 hypothetical protein [Candidatus Aminicenantes bacterium]NIN46566.1 hypothetical protein [Candidatus Aminicenantes bacterium]NIN89469.1 hypothetical protein [Candidatus Aminicenantes bacterium]